MQKIVVFDLDDTLSESKTDLDAEMAELLARLINKARGVGIISGCAHEQMVNQLLMPLSRASVNYSNDKLYLMPASGSQLYTHGDYGWELQYKESLLLREKCVINQTFFVACKLANIYPIDPPYDEIGEDRDSQITYSFCGQKAPSDVKKTWDPDRSKRLVVAQRMRDILAEDKIYHDQFEITVGGATSIDVTKKGRDKAYGMLKFINYLNISKEDILFVADALFEGGNDFSVKAAGFNSISVDNPEDTKQIIKDILGNNNATI